MEPFSFPISCWFAEDIWLFSFSLSHLTIAPLLWIANTASHQVPLLPLLITRVSWCKTTFPPQLELFGYLERLLYRKWRINEEIFPSSCQFAERAVLQFSPVSPSDCSSLSPPAPLAPSFSSLSFPLSLFFPSSPWHLVKYHYKLSLLIYSVHFSQLQWLPFDPHIFLSLVNGSPQKLASVTFDMTLLRTSQNLFSHFFLKPWSQLSLSGVLPRFGREWLLENNIRHLWVGFAIIWRSQFLEPSMVQS